MSERKTGNDSEPKFNKQQEEEKIAHSYINWKKERKKMSIRCRVTYRLLEMNKCLWLHYFETQFVLLQEQAGL